MKKKITLYLGMIILILMMSVVNGFLFYSAKCTDEYLQTSNVWGTSSSIKRIDYLHQTQILQSLPHDREDALHLLTQKLWALREEQTQIQTTRKPTTAEQTRLKTIETDISNYIRLYHLLLNVQNYKQYINSVLTNTDNIASLLVPLSGDGWMLRNLAQSEKDYYGMEYLTLIPVLDDGVNMVLQYHITDFLAFLLLTFLSLFFAVYMKKQSYPYTGDVRRPILMTFLFAVFGTVGLYLTNFLILVRILGMPALSVPLQSLESFYSCPFSVSLGTFLVIWMLFKICTLLFLLFLCLLILSGGHPVLYGLAGSAFLMLEYRLSRLPDQAVRLLPFREINLFSGFTGERFFNRYLNLNVYERVVSRLPLYLTVFLPVFILLVYLTCKRGKQLLLQNTATLQKIYFEEVDNRYQETRRLWHDFNNHLLAVKALYSSGKAPEAEKYIDELMQKSRENLLPARTGSNAVDLLLFQKFQQARDAGIAISFTVGCDLKNHNLKDYDLCALTGNLLDNALEACQPLSGQHPQILLRMEEMGSMLYLSCQNPYEGERTPEDGQLPTTKPEKDHHGIGLSSVRQICKKYQGNMEICTEDGLFTVRLLLNDSRRA